MSARFHSTELRLSSCGAFPLPAMKFSFPLVCAALVFLAIVPGSNAQERAEVSLKWDDDPRPTDFVWKTYASGKKVEQRKFVPYVIILWESKDNTGNLYQIWGCDKKVGREVVEKALVELMAAAPTDLYVVGQEWDEGLDRVVKEVTGRHKVDAFFNHVMPRIVAVDFNTGDERDQKMIQDAVEKASRLGDKPPADRPPVKPADKARPKDQPVVPKPKDKP